MCWQNFIQGVFLLDPGLIVSVGCASHLYIVQVYECAEHISCTCLYKISQDCESTEQERFTVYQSGEHTARLVPRSVYGIHPMLRSFVDNMLNHGLKPKRILDKLAHVDPVKKDATLKSQFPTAKQITTVSWTFLLKFSCANYVLCAVCHFQCTSLHA